MFNNPWQLDVLTLASAHGLEQLQEDEGLAAQLVQLRPALCECAAHVAAGCFDDANRCFERILGLAALGDGPLQRLAKIFVDGLVRRRLGTINRALIDSSSSQQSVRAARYNFFKLLPFLKVAYVAINRVILDAMENEKFVHIIDLSGPAAHPWQWLKLMHAFHRRPDGAPDLRITVVHNDAAFLADTSARLRKEAESLDKAFSFHGFVGRLETLDFGNLHAALAIKSGYARAFSCALQMRRLLPVDAHAMVKMNPSPTTPLSPFFAPTPSPQRLVPPLLTQFQHAVKALSPKVLAVVEQEAGHNGPDFAARFEEALHYYAALFDALHDRAGAGCGVMQDEEERAQVEQIVLGEEVKDVLVRGVVAEPLHHWAARMMAGGFGGVPLSYVAKMEADEVLRKFRLRGYENRGHENCLLLCRNGRPLYAVSAWRPWSCSEASAYGSSQEQHVLMVPGHITSTWTWPQQQPAPVHNFTS